MLCKRCRSVGEKNATCSAPTYSVLRTYSMPGWTGLGKSWFTVTSAVGSGSSRKSVDPVLCDVVDIKSFDPAQSSPLTPTQGLKGTWKGQDTEAEERLTVQHLACWPVGAVSQWHVICHVEKGSKAIMMTARQLRRSTAAPRASHSAFSLDRCLLLTWLKVDSLFVAV